MVLIFDSEKAARELDTRACYNAYADKKWRVLLGRIVAKGGYPSVRFRLKEEFFGKEQWSYNSVGHYKYKGRAISEFCERKSLALIYRVE